MSKTVSDFLLQRLSAWGVKRIFGYPGDGILGIMGALERHQDLFQLVQVRHEEMAAFMACGHAKYTGELGVCMATSGPGAIHLLNGLYDAKMDHQPVLAIVGQSARTALGGNYQQEVDLMNLFRDVAGEYVQTCTDAIQMRQLVDRACRIALAERTVTCIIMPKDVQDLDAVEKPPHKHNTVHTSLGYTPPYTIPRKEDLQRAADILNTGKKVAILIGAGAMDAGPEVTEVADLLGCGVAKALLGKAVLPDHLPFVTGGLGLLGTTPSWNMMMHCDTLLMVGSSFPYSEFLPKEGQARGIQIDIDPHMVGIRYPMELNLIGDSVESLRALIPLLKRKEDRSWREKIESEIVDWWKTVEARSKERADPINPEWVAWELSPRLPDRAILSADSGTTANWYGRTIKMREGMKGSVSGSLASLGAAVPYAIAAKFAYPDRVPVALTGDGAFQMNGLSEMLTVPLAPSSQPGYYPGFQTLSQQAFWDEATRRVVRARVEQVPPIRFFTQQETMLMQAVCDRLLPQDDRDVAHKIPIVNAIDERLSSRRIDGYRFEDMPPDHEAHRLGLQAIEAIAQHLYHASFVDLEFLQQDMVLKSIHDAQPPAAHEIWQKMSVYRFWLLLMQDAVDAYYAHPYAWDEIGFGGPAYPRGYMRLEGGRPEPWEVEEQRYTWDAPATSLSDAYEPVGGPGGHKQQPSGQEGTH